MNEQQRTALKHHCRLAMEVIHPRFVRKFGTYTLLLTVDSGYG